MLLECVLYILCAINGDDWMCINECKMCLLSKEGPVVQSIVSLTSLLVVKMLTVLVSIISNSQVFLLKKMLVAFANAKATHIFSAKILAYMAYLMVKVLMIR